VKLLWVPVVIAVWITGQGREGELMHGSALEEVVCETN